MYIYIQREVNIGNTNERLIRHWHTLTRPPSFPSLLPPPSLPAGMPTGSSFAAPTGVGMRTSRLPLGRAQTSPRTLTGRGTRGRLCA